VQQHIYSQMKKTVFQLLFQLVSKRNRERIFFNFDPRDIFLKL